ncbi:hypothetical protein GCM10010493_57230 [Streptomyces lavendulae subsp. grasserius]
MLRVLAPAGVALQLQRGGAGAFVEGSGGCVADAGGVGPLSVGPGFQGLEGGGGAFTGYREGNRLPLP